MTSDTHQDAPGGVNPGGEGSAAERRARPEAQSPALLRLKESLAAVERDHWAGLGRRLLAAADAQRGPAETALRRALRTLKRRTHRHVRARLRGEMSAMAERHRARWTGIFVLRGDKLLEIASSGYVTRKPSGEDINGPGIVPLVARTREAYCAGVVDNDSHYRLVNPASRSEQAAPIVFEGRLLGVLNQESHEPGMFSPATAKALEQEATALIPHLLAGAAEDDESAVLAWNPELHGWSHGLILQEILAAIRASLKPAARAMHLTLWYADPDDEVLFALASTGYGDSFSRTRVLPVDGSFAGRCACLERGEVADCSAGDALLCRPEVDQDMGLTRIRAVTIRRLERGGGGVGGAPGLVLSFYVFDEEAEPSLPSPAELKRLAAILERQFDQYWELRPVLAAAAMAQALRSCLATDDELNVAAEALKDSLLEADAATEFVAPVASFDETGGEEPRRLRVAGGTSPLYSSADPSPGANPLWSPGNAALETEYRVGDNTLTGRLAADPGKVHRLNRPPRDRPEAGFRTTGNRLHEKLPRVVRKFPRRLNYGVRDADEAAALGVVRVVRSFESKPFALSDAATLAKAAQVCEDAMRSWRDREEFASNRPELTASRRRLLLPPPRPVIRPARLILREILEEVHGVIRDRLDDCVLQAAVLVETENSQNPMRVFEYHSTLQSASAFDGGSPAPPAQFDPLDLRLHGQPWLAFLDAGRAATFTRPDPGDRRPGVRAGARVPLQFWCGGHSQRGALIVDLTRPKSLRSVVDDLNLAAQKLALVMTLAGCEAARTAPPRLDPAAFVNGLRARLGAAAVALSSVPADHGAAVWSTGDAVPSGWFAAKSAAHWRTPTIQRNGDETIDHDARRWGVLERQAGSREYLMIPARQGFETAATLIVGWERDQQDQPDRGSLRSRRVRDCLALAGLWLWSLAVDEAVESTPTSGEVEGDAIHWNLGIIDLARLAAQRAFAPA